jgi:hypothetical protein
MYKKSGIKNSESAKRYFDKITRRYFDEGSKEAYLFLVEEAYRFKSELIRAIEEQSIDWPPLSPGYKSYKRKKGLDPRMLIATRRLINSFIVRQDLMNLRVIVMVDPNAHYEGNLSVAFIDKILEYGTMDGRIPARPHWRVVVKRFQSKIGSLRVIGSTRVKKAITNL